MSAMKTIEGFITNEEGKLYIEESTGKVYMNKTSLSEVCGVSRSSIDNALEQCTKTLDKYPEGIQGIQNVRKAMYKEGAKGAVLIPEETVVKMVEKYARKGKGEAVNYLMSFALIGFRQATYNALGYELPKLEVNPIKTFPKYERTVSDWLEDRFKKDYKLIEREFRLPSNCRADFLLNNRIIVEVKRIENWKLAVGQVLSYKIELQKLGCKNISTQVELFGTIDTAEQEELREDINKMGVNKVGFITDINLIYDRR